MRCKLLARGLWPWISLSLLALLAGQTYAAYEFPIKQDAFGHAFREHLGDRLVAYAWLARSSHKFARLGVAEIDALIEEKAAEHGVDPSLAKAVAAYESDYLPNAISTTGAMGLMALMPETARLLGVRDPFDARENADAGVRLLRDLLAAHDGDVALTLAAYNAGPGAVRRHGGVPPFVETTTYVDRVMRLRESFAPTGRAAKSPGLAAR